MKELLDRVVLDNTLRDYLLVFGIILAAWTVKKYISLFFTKLMYKSASQFLRGVDQSSLNQLVVKPLARFLAILITLAALYKLKLPSVLQFQIYKYSVSAILHVVGKAVVIGMFIVVLLRFIDFLAGVLEQKANLTPDQADNQLIVFFKDFFKILLIIIGVMLILRYAIGMNITGLVAGLSIVGAAVALALRESLENLIASFIIFFDKPFVTGDLVKVHHITGQVERIGLRSTRIRTDQKTYVTVPNKQMVDSILDNLSLRTQRRGDLRIEVSLQTSSSKLEKLIHGIESIMKKPAVQQAHIHFAEIAGNAFVIQSDYYTAPVSLQEFNHIRQSIHLDILKLMEELHIEIAGANTDVRISRED
ncbi:MAG: mechanosensitive ion channel family protein [Chitinophagaceae bacterium]|nr:mechanosensitive ion channel family protein [Chitinophagaceae bacterium]